MGGGDLRSALRTLREGRADTVVILENDLYRSAESAVVDAALRAARHVIVIDHIHHATAERAELVLPAATFAEDSGTLVSNEGRAQRFYQVLLPHDDSPIELALAAGFGIGRGRAHGRRLADARRRSIADLAASCRSSARSWRSRRRRISSRAGRRSRASRHATAGAPRSMRTINVSEPKPPEDPDSPLAFSMEGDEGQPPSGTDPALLGAGLEFRSVGQQIPGGDRRSRCSGGDPGRRLIEAPAGARPEYFGEVPPAFEPPDRRNGCWSRCYHIFGSEKLSMLSPAIAGLAGAPYVALRPDEAAGRGAAEGDLVRVVCGGRVLELPVRLMPSLPAHVAGLPSGFPNLRAAGASGHCLAHKKAAGDRG